MRTDVEEVSLHGEQLVIDGRRRPRGARDAEMRIQLVDGAVGLDAGVVLRNTRTAEERRLAAVAGARVDLHASDSSCRIRSFTTISAMSGITSHAIFFTSSAESICTTRRAIRSMTSSGMSPENAAACGVEISGSTGASNGTSSAAAGNTDTGAR